MPITSLQTDLAPKAIGTYSQAIKTGNTIYLSGQIPLLPETMELVASDMEAQVRQVFDNLSAVCSAADGDLSRIVKLNIFLLELDNFPLVNKIMSQYFTPPYPARAVIGVAALPRAVGIEIDAVMVLD